MTIQRMDNIGVVVDDLEAAIAFFLELGLELAGEATLEGRWVDRVVNLDNVRVDIAMVKTSDGDGGLPLTKFYTPTASTAEPNAPLNTLGIRRIVFAVTDCAPMAPNSLGWLSRSAEDRSLILRPSACPPPACVRSPKTMKPRLSRLTDRNQ
jgi:hypothetical protein